MKVIVTGAAGSLGRVVCRTLVEGGYEVSGIDKSFRAKSPCRIQIADLASREAAYPLLEGADALVHLANIPNQHMGDAQTVFNTNVTTNMNVFQAAYECGVQKIIFASSIQAILGERSHPFDKPVRPLPYLPIEASIPPLPQNPYALSKAVGECQLEYFSRMGDISAVAIRFPWLVRNDHRELRFLFRRPPVQALAILHMNDAAALISAALDRPLPGFRIYLPSSHDLVERLGGPRAVAAQYFSDVPIPNGQLDYLVDNTKITEDTGWEPRHSLKELMDNIDSKC